jgi:hypothetical protein
VQELTGFNKLDVSAALHPVAEQYSQQCESHAGFGQPEHKLLFGVLSDPQSVAGLPVS